MPGSRDHLLDSAVGNAASMSEDGDPITRRFDLGEDVARDEHGPPFVSQPTQQMTDLPHPGRVQAVRRFVEDQELRILEDRRSERQPLLHAERVTPDQVVGTICETDDVEDVVDASSSDSVD